ncbi:MAG: hypothetical protein Q9Q40_09410 [Acidobacteriota bacterium]|nr:hypothetical protein [Acidobacteriota bacterium]MDQ7086504.1 hypothetical protein [Acidobacteriota bacterium]
MPYYVLSPMERVRHPWHSWFKPSGLIGQSAGIFAFLLFAFLWLYPLRKRVRWKFLGPVPRWLDYHIAAGLLVPLVGAIHAGWRFGGLIGLGYGAMLVVCISGIAGKYVYVRIPRSNSGIELTLAEIESRRQAMLDQWVRLSGMERAVLEAALAAPSRAQAPRGRLATVTQMVRDDLERRRRARALCRRWKQTLGAQAAPSRKAIRLFLNLARREMALRQQARLLEATRRVFEFWHAAHLPVAVTAFAAVLLHVAVVLFLGATWFW